MGAAGRRGFDCIGDVAAREKIAGGAVTASIARDESARRREMSPCGGAE